jgi:hypothetical protein
MLSLSLETETTPVLLCPFFPLGEVRGKIGIGFTSLCPGAFLVVLWRLTLAVSLQMLEAA